MTDAAVIDLERLLQPIAPDRPGGEDISFSAAYDEIKEARTEDDPRLAAGVWQRELKTADWPRVQSLATRILAEQSKDLQVACWLTEALGRLHGFAGARDGLALLAGLLERHWEHLHPGAEDGDLDARANVLGRLSSTLGRQIRAQAVTLEGRGWYAYQDALAVDNAAQRDRNAKAALLAEGKIDGDTWRKDVAATPDEDLARQYQEVQGALQTFERLDAAIDPTFGTEGPSLRDLRTALQDVLQLLAAIAKERGIAAAPPPPAAVGSPAPVMEEQAMAAVATAVAGDGQAGAAPAASFAPGPVQTRDEALRQLAQIAEYFRRNEPHSPVGYLLERAVKWGNMPLDLWLQEVVKDPNVLTVLHETLGVGPRE